MNRIIKPAKWLRGRPVIPGDKSISHRALIFGALAEGQTQVADILESADVQSTARCLTDLGVKITKNENKTIVEGVGSSGFKAPTKILDCGNSGTTMRLLMGVLAGRNITATMTGDASLTGRPMKRVAEPLRLMGAQFELTRENYAPLTVTGSPLQAIDYDLKIASAQIKSSIMLAALSARGTTVIRGEVQSRDHTERMLEEFGVPVGVTTESISVQGGSKLKGTFVQVPGDPSTAAFWLAGACLLEGSAIEMGPISLNPTRIGFIRALQLMGAPIETQIETNKAEPIGTVRIRSGPIRGIKITHSEVPSMIDEIPMLAVLATQANGVTEVSGAEELRVKETDRIEAVATNLRAMGAEIEVQRDGFRIRGPQRLKGTTLSSFHDHRIAMAFSIAALVAEGETTIEGAECVEISYPRFFDELEGLRK